jgi:transposase
MIGWQGTLSLCWSMRPSTRQVPGHKTDVQDADWLADLLQHGLLKPSFVPDQPQQDLRDLTRLRVHLIQDRTQLINRILKVLQQGGIKLSGVLSNVMGVGGTSNSAGIVCRRT